jgi:hypothetical protein
LRPVPAVLWPGRRSRRPPPLPFVAPGESVVGVGGVVAEHAEPGVCDGADLPRGDQVAGRRDGGRVAVVEAHRAVHRGLAYRLPHGPGVGGGQPGRLLDPDVLARLRHRDADLAVEEVRRGDRHRVHPRVGGDLTPVVRGRGEAVPRGGVGGPAGHVVGDRHQLRPHAQLREVVGQPRVRLGVDPAHPAEPDDSHPDLTCHDRAW